MPEAGRDAGVVQFVRVESEREADRGWSSWVRVQWADGVATEHEVRLSWADHDYLSGGTVPPSATVELAVRVCAESLGRETLPGKFDLSTMRRLVKGLDRRFVGGEEP